MRLRMPWPFLRNARFSGLISKLFNDQQAADIEQFKGLFG